MGMLVARPSGLTLARARAARPPSASASRRACGATPTTPLARVATATGSAGSLVGDALATGAQALVAGEVRYHDALDAVESGLAIIELGHDVSEWPLVGLLADAVRAHPGLGSGDRARAARHARLVDTLTEETRMTQAASLLELQRPRPRDPARQEAPRRAAREARDPRGPRTRCATSPTLHDKADLLVGKLDGRPQGPSGRDRRRSPSKIDAEQAKVMATTDHRAGRSSSRARWTACKRRRDKLEMETLQLMERIDKATRADGEDRRGARAARREGGRARRALQGGRAARSRPRSPSWSASARRLAAASRPADCSRATSRSARARAASASGGSRATTCSACRMTLPAERVQRARRRAPTSASARSAVA